MLHCKVSIPPYRANKPNAYKKERRFDINWELGGIKHEWNKLLWELRYLIEKYK